MSGPFHLSYAINPQGDCVCHNRHNKRLPGQADNGVESESFGNLERFTVFLAGVSGSWEPAMIERNAIALATPQRNTL